MIPLSWYFINRTRQGMHLRAVGEYPSAVDAQGISVYGMRYFYIFVGGMLAGLAGAAISLAISPGWFAEKTTSGQGWIAVGLVIFAQWDPIRAAFGGYIFGALRRLVLDIQARRSLWSRKSFLLQPLLWLFPKNATLRFHGDRVDYWFTRGQSQTGRFAGSARSAIHPRSTRFITQSIHL